MGRSNRMGLLAGTFALLSFGSLQAQQTWIVDQGGLGNFTSIPPAISAASPGDTIVVRAGSYSPFAVDRSLHFVGEGRPLLQDFSISTSGLNLSLSGLDIANCTVAASVCTFEDVRFDYRCSLSYSSGVMVRCSNTVTGSPNYFATVWLNGSDFAFDQCTFGGSGALILPSLGCGLIHGAYHALRLFNNSTASVAGCVLTGGGGSWSIGCGHVPGASAIGVDPGSSLRVTQSLVNGGATPFGPAAPISNGGSPTAVLVDPSVQFTGPQTGVTITAVPSLTGQGDVAGGVMTCLLETAPNRAAAIVASIGSRSPAASPYGAAWVDLGAFVVLRLGSTGAAGTMGVSIGLPASVQRGLPITLQAVVNLGPTPALTESGPTILHVL